MADTFPELMINEDVQLAFKDLAAKLNDVAQAHGLNLPSIALCYAVGYNGRVGFNCIFDEHMTEDLAEGMAGVLMMDAEDCDAQIDLTPLVRQ